MTILNQEALQERANNLFANDLNGFKLVLVTLHPPVNPTEARLEVHFHNKKKIGEILVDLKAPALIFPISGGHRLPAGPAADQVKVTSISQGPSLNSLVLTISPIGDYSTYTLSIDFQNMDPVFNDIGFKFRPGCFNLCTPDWDPAPEPRTDPVIDYLAKDYDSFRHTMITAMMERVPGWEVPSEADQANVLLSLFSAAADELSDYQDRVMNEAYLATARKRVSMARHARLMDYHIHQGNQADTWLALRVDSGAFLNLSGGFPAATGDISDPSSVVFITRELQQLHRLLNQTGLYTWNDSVPALAAGSTGADLKLLDNDLNPITDQASADTFRDLIRNGVTEHLLIQERLNPATGKVAGRDRDKRQLLKLLPGDAGAETMKDPLTGEFFVRVRWEERDKLRYDYCFTVDCSDGKVEDVSLFHGNLVQVHHGRQITSIFKEPGTILTNPGEFHYERIERSGKVRAALCRLPEGPLLYKDTPPGGEVTLESTFSVEELPGNLKWDEKINLIHSDDSDEQGRHFMVETDEEGRSLIRFGNGINGKELPEDAIVHCTYQIGRGPEGNIGADKLTRFDPVVSPGVIECWNPFDVTNGRAPEPVEEIIRRVPEAYRARQLRAVTLKDYMNRAEELDEVSRAAARYVCTGSWKAVRIAIDPAGTTELNDELRRKIANHLDAVRLIGEDLEIRQPQFVPLDIQVSLCIHADYWPEDIRSVLEQEFSNGYTPDGRTAFFHPDQWTFGQELRASQIIGRVQLIQGIDHVVFLTMKRWNEVTPGPPDIIEVRPNEIILVRNNRDHLEEGFIFFDIRGGRE